MRYFWVIALISIALSSKINAKSVPFAVDPFDQKCASLALISNNWNFQIPVNLTLIPSLSFISLNTDISKEKAEWIERTWEATKGSANLGTLQPGITLVKGFALFSPNSYTPFLVMIKEDGVVEFGYAIPFSKSDLCSMAMGAADKTIVTLDSFDNMFQPIDKELATEVGEHAGDILHVAMTWLMWIGIAVGVIVLLCIIGCILCCCFC